MTDSKDSRQKFIAAAAVLFIALLGINAYLLYNKVQQDNTIETQTMEIDEAERLKVELEKNYYESLSELESMKTGNQELNVLIDAQKSELEEQRNRIRSLINSGNRSKKELTEARDQIAGIRSQLDGYVGEVNKLKGEIETLTEANTELTTANQNLSMDLSSQKTVNDELTTAKAALVSEKEDLITEKSKLSKVVTKASVIKVGEVSASAWRVRKSGKPAKTKSAGKTDRIKVCFTTTANEVANAGNERFYIRVLSPLGQTLAVENLGSGIMTTANMEEIRFTQAKDLPYENNSLVGCFLWEPNLAFSSGKYAIEVYNKGHLAGSGDFLLK
ncbi:MAG: hypothetical protein HKN16_00555 [Saprospiraceae bacterium]|nr:hypothetical protein [Saprospiraceae bacterium]